MESEGRRMASRATRCCQAAAVVAALVSCAGPAQCEERVKPALDVVGTTLRLRLPDGSVTSGTELTGAVLAIATGNRTLRVRIAGVEPDPRDPRGEVLLYDFRVIGPSGEEPLCLPDPDGRRLALPLAGRSDASGIVAPVANTFELACTAGAQAKCVRLGYAPWRQTPDGRPLRDWFDACVRMMRGDYCGDGRPYTRNGTWIDIYDRIGVQASDGDPTLRFEAVWGPDGAVCVARTRLPDVIDLDGLARACPRLSGRLGPGCREDAEGLIVNRSR
jgi:hypothetical protein